MNLRASQLLPLRQAPGYSKKQPKCVRISAPFKCKKVQICKITSSRFAVEKSTVGKKSPSAFDNF